MNKPQKIRILHLDYSIKWEEEWEMGGSLGASCYAGQFIKMNKTQPPQQMADTFLHEVLHAITGIFGITDRTPEEDTCHRFAAALCCVWRDNPEVFEWWKNLLTQEASHE